MTRTKILITGASSGPGGGMARESAARGRDRALAMRFPPLSIVARMV